MNRKNYYKPKISVQQLSFDVLMLSVQSNGYSEVDGGDTVTIGSDFWK